MTFIKNSFYHHHRTLNKDRTHIKSEWDRKKKVLGKKTSCHFDSLMSAHFLFSLHMDWLAGPGHSQNGTHAFFSQHHMFLGYSHRKQHEEEGLLFTKGSRYTLQCLTNILVKLLTPRCSFLVPEIQLAIFSCVLVLPNRSDCRWEGSIQSTGLLQMPGLLCYSSKLDK